MGVGGAKPVPGCAEPALHRALGNAELPGDLLLGQLLKIEQTQHPRVPAPQVRERLLHGGVGAFLRRHVGQRFHRRLRPPGLPTIPVPQFVSGNAEEPGQKGVPVLQPGEGPVGRQVRFLQDVLSVRAAHMKLHPALHAQPVFFQQSFKLVHGARLLSV